MKTGCITDNLNMLVTEIRDLVSQKVGVTAFSRTWEGIRSRTVDKRAQRRMDANERMVREPQLEATRRAKRAGMKVDHKKKKQRAFA
jgi:U3 small nucleolar RNA-associated protein 20